MSAPGRITLAKAIESKRLLGAGYAPWPMQRVILENVEQCTRSVLVLGRRSGKTRGISAPYMVYRATCCPHLSACVQKGETVYHVAVAPKQAQAALLLSECKRLIEASPVFRTMVTRVTDSIIELSNGHAILVLTASGRTGRGWPIATLDEDEVAYMHNDTDGPATAREVFRALSPATAQFGDDRRVILCSTPNGQGDFFHERFQRALAAIERGDTTQYVAWLPTNRVNPTIPQSVYDQELEDLGPEQFGCEYLVQWLASGASLLSEADIRSCIRDGAPELDPTEVEDVVVGADFGFRRDPSVAVAVGRHKVTGTLTVASIRSWSPPADLTDGTWSHQLMVYREVADLARRYGNAPIRCDTFESQTVRAQLSKLGAWVELVPMGTEKVAIHLELARGIRGGLVSYPDHPELISDLRRLKINYGGARPTVVNPRSGGRHGDVGQAFAVALSAFARDGAEGPVVAAVAHPGVGWLDGDAGASGADPVPGSAAYNALSTEEQFEICQRRIGRGRGDFAITPSNVDRGYQSGIAWLDAPAYVTRDW